MQKSKFPGCPSSFMAQLKRCKSVNHLHQLHAQAITNSFLSHHSTPVLTNVLYTFTALIPTCSHSASKGTRRRLIAYVTSVFEAMENPSTFCYNTLIRAHTLLSCPSPALQLFVEMRCRPVPLDFHSFPFVLKACAQLQAVVFVRMLHSLVVRMGSGADIFVLNSLIHAYSACDRMDDALEVFDDGAWKDVVTFNILMDGLIKKGDVDVAREFFELMPVRDAVSWGTLITGYAQTNRSELAIELFDRMMDLGVRPDNTALVSVLSACAHIREIDQGRRVHDFIRKTGIKIDSFLCTGLVDMYAKCGLIEVAIKVFHESSEQNVCTWNALLVGLAMHGHGQLALQYFSRMTVDTSIQPDGVTVLGALVACSHSGLVHEACEIFEKMESVYGVPRECKHYGCMADLLGRAGMVQEAVAMIQRMPNMDDIFVWGSLLGGCRKHGNIKVAEKAAKQVMELFPEDGGVYSVMADVYANADRWSDVVKTRASLSAGAAIKIVGCSLIRPDELNRRFLCPGSRYPLIAGKHEAPAYNYR